MPDCRGLCAALAAVSLSLAAPPRVPYHYAENFDSGQAAGWTSYPPVQDVAYDPSLSPLPREGGGFSMGRIVRPTRAGPLEIGFIRRMTFTTSADLRLSFALELDPDAPVSVEAGLAGTSGTLYRAAAKPGVVRLRAEDFHLKGGEEVEAVYVLARIGRASAAIEYTLRLDDVALDAMRPPRAPVSEPALVESRGWEKRVASRVYAYSDELPLKGARLIAPDGAPRAATGPFRPGDPPGLWEARLADDSSVAFLLVGKRPAAHPRVFDLAELRSRARDPQFTSAWKSVQDRAARARREGPLPAWTGENFLRLYPDRLLPGLASYITALSRTRELVLPNALVAAVEENPDARNAAKRGLLDAASWPTWTPPWFSAHGMHTYYEAGIFVRAMALGYDLLYPHLDEAERSAVPRALRELGIRPTFHEHFLDARMPFATSNWIGNSLSGGIVAAAVTDGEDPEPDLPGILTGLVARLRQHVNDTILADGSSGEPLGYQDFDLEGVGWSMGALERAYGIDFHPGTALRTAHLYAVYSRIAERDSPDMGDGGLHSARGFAWLARHNDDPSLRRLYREMPREPVGELALGPAAGAGAGAGPPLPPSRYFDNKGAAVLRSGWDPDAAVFAFRAGPHFNHNHMDAGGFLLSARGEALLSEAGVTHYYNDPHYGSHFIQAAGHNVMLVDGDPESQIIPDFLWVKALGRRPRWGTVVLSEAADFFETELRAVYKAPLESYRRAVLYVRPGYFVVYDRVSAREKHAFSWLFHPPAESRLRLEPGGFALDRSAASLQARLVADSVVELREREWPARVAELENLASRKLSAWKYVEASAPPAPRAALIAVLSPLRPGEQGPKIEEVKAAGALGVRVGDSDFIAFKTGSGPLRAGEAETDGDSLFVRASSAGVERLAVDSATRVAWRGRELLSSPAPVSISALWEGGRVRGTVRAARAIEVNLGGTRIAARAGETVF